MSFVLGGNDLSLTLPDGTSLFDGLDFNLGSGRIGLIGRNGVGKSTLLFLLAGRIEPSGGSVVRSGRMALLEQDAHGASFESVADALGVTALLDAFERSTNGSATQADLSLLEGNWDLPERLHAVLDAVGLPGIDSRQPYRTLSGGEQTRIRFARVLLKNPDIVLLDEPTNHLDRAGRAFVLEWIESWKSGLVVASHDRELLEQMDQIARLDANGLRLYGGNFSFYLEQRELERAAAERRLFDAQKEHRLARQQAQTMRERQDQRKASGKRAGRRSGVGKMAAGNFQRAAEATAGRLGDRHAAKVEATSEAVQEAREAVLVEETISIDLSFTEIPARKRIASLRGVNVRFEGPGHPLWQEPVDLDVVGPERLAIVGPNGSGKSTLLRLIEGSVPPTSGSREIAAGSVALLDQQVTNLDSQLSVLENAVQAAPARPVQETRLLLARFLFDKFTVDKPVSVLSGGERMRAGLACLLSRDQAPELLLLDEPTNNLDLPSLNEIIAVLSAYRGALIVISHDETFLDDIGVERRVHLPSPTARV